jgi:nucleoside-diphosphate-sugar epimerase
LALSYRPTNPQANHVVFHTNILQTYNILEASRVLRIKNIALASSETVFGLPLHPHKPTKLPISEEVERPESSYSLSKLMGEKMAEQFCRWDPETKIINIRLSNVMAPEDYKRFPGWQDDPWSRAWK